jgi:hypothetical protein
VQQHTLEDAIKKINGTVVPLLVPPFARGAGWLSCHRLIEYTKCCGRINRGISIDDDRATIRKVTINQQTHAIWGRKGDLRVGPEPRVVPEG